MEEQKEEQEEKQICCFCKEKMDFNARHVLLGTYQSTDTIEEQWFHFDCFRRWHDKKTREKAQNIVNDMQTKAMGLMGNIQGMLGNLAQGMGVSIPTEIEIVQRENKEAQDIIDEVNDEQEKKKNSKREKGN